MNQCKISGICSLLERCILDTMCKLGTWVGTYCVHYSLHPSCLIILVKAVVVDCGD